MHVLHLPEHRLPLTIALRLGLMRQLAYPAVLHVGRDGGAVEVRELLLLGRVAHHDPAHVLRVRTGGRAVARVDQPEQQLLRQRIWFQPPHRTAVLDDVEDADLLGHVPS